MIDDEKQLASEIRRLIETGEGERIEFKSARVSGTTLSETVICLANNKGGLILLGVEDNGKITGCDIIDTDELVKKIYDGTQPHIIVNCETCRLPEGEVVLLRVPRSPLACGTSSGKYLRRVGKQCKPMHSLEFTRLKVERGELDYSAQPVREAPGNWLSSSALERVRQILEQRNSSAGLHLLDERQLLLALNLSRETSKSVAPTVSGILAVGKPSVIRKLYPQSEIIYIHGKPGAYSFREDVRLPIILALDKIESLIQGRNLIHHLQVGLFRLEIPDFPLEVCQEAFLNAVVHRDYLASGSIFIKHLDDSMEIENPGGFPEGVSKDNIIYHPSKPRNRTLAELFQHLRYVQRAGMGVDLMFRTLLSLGKELPEYESGEDFVRLTFRNGTFSEDFARFAKEQQYKGTEIKLDELIVFSFLRRRRHISVAEAAEACQRHSAKAQNVLENMTGKGWLEALGNKTEKRYTLSNQMYARLRSAVEYVKDRGIDRIRHPEMVTEFIRQNGSISNAECRGLCGLTRLQAYRMLQNMVNTGALTPVGNRPRFRYILHRNAKE